MGYEPDRLIVATPEFDDAMMADEQVTPFYMEAIERLRALPAVENAAATAALPFYWSLGTWFEIPGREELPDFSDGGPYIYPVTTEYMATTGIRVTRGRGFTAADDASAPRVMIVGEHLAAAYWPGEDPIGACVHINKDEGCTQVIGIAEATNRGSFPQQPSGQYYVPLAQWPGTFSPQTVVVRAAPGRIEALLPAVQREMQTLSPAVRYVNVRGFREMIDPGARSWELGATMFSAFGGLALLIASVGLYGVLSFTVAQRRQEIGLRSALGASARGLIGMVAWQATRMVGLGVLLGAGVALAAGPWVEPMLFEVDARDPAVFLLVTLVLAAVAVVAATLPARRAARVEPVTALRRS